MRIGIISRAILIGEALRLGLQMDRQGRLEACPFQVEMLEDVQHLQGRDALRIGAEGIDVGAAIARFVRLDPFGLVRSEEHTSELQSLMRLSSAVFCLTTKNLDYQDNNPHHQYP